MFESLFVNFDKILTTPMVQVLIFELRGHFTSCATRVHEIRHHSYREVFYQAENCTGGSMIYRRSRYITPIQRSN